MSIPHSGSSSQKKMKIRNMKTCPRKKKNRTWQGVSIFGRKGVYGKPISGCPHVFNKICPRQKRSRPPGGSDSGGGMWESNPPRRLFAVRTGFEDRKAHQHPSAPVFSFLEESKGKGPEPPGQQSAPAGLSHLNVHVQTAEVALPDGDASAVAGFQKQQGVLPGGSQRIPQLSQCDGAMSGALSL